MAARAKGQVSKVLVWIILALLIVGLAGFGATNFGGSVHSLGRVGDTEIPVQRYARALQQELRGIQQQTGTSVTMAQAQAFGLDRAVLQGVVGAAALEDEAATLGLSVGDETVGREILNVPGFRGLDGQFDREAYEFALQQNGMSVKEFEADLRREAASDLLSGAVVAGVATPDVLVDTLYTYAREQRDLTVARLGADDLAQPVEAPSEQALKDYHAANAERYTRPETRQVTYAWVTPEMMIDSVEVDEDILRERYEAQRAEFDQPERRIVDRLVYSTAEAAEAAKARIEAGETDFDALIAERGLTAADADLGELTKDDLGAAGEAVFALAEPGIAGPAETPLGPALFRVNTILDAQSVSFEDARDELRRDIAADRARRLIEEQIEPIEDALAGGATIEELAEETPLELGEIALNDESEGGIAGYDAFREAANAFEPGDFPELGELADGGLFTLRVDEVTAPELRPLDEVRDQVAADWRAEETARLLTVRAETLIEEMEGGTSLETLGLTPETYTGVLRDGFVEDLPDAAITGAFEMEEGQAMALPAEGGAVIVRLDAIKPADGGSDEAQRIKAAVAGRMAQSYAQDTVDAFTRAIQAQKGIELNQSAINAVHAQFP